MRRNVSRRVVPEDQLTAEVRRLTEENAVITLQLNEGRAIDRLNEEVRRLTEENAKLTLQLHEARALITELSGGVDFSRSHYRHIITDKNVEIESLHRENKLLKERILRHTVEEPRLQAMIAELEKNLTTSKNTLVDQNQALDIASRKVVAMQEVFENIRECVTCPITRDFFSNPWVSIHGYTFEYQAIKDWTTRHRSCPMTRNGLDSWMTFPNRTVKNIVDQVRSVEMK